MDALTPLEDAVTSTSASEAAGHPTPIEQIVLVFQGSGALAAYQAGVYQALTEGGIEPDWVIGTSIGAINGALIAGNKRRGRLSRLQEYERPFKRRGRVKCRPIEHLKNNSTRLTVGAVSVRTGEMRYFDTRDMSLGLEHVMASGALPPGFPAVRVDGEPYWDGGLYSNTPVEMVFDDKPRRSSLIFSVNMWQPHGAEPQTIWEVLGRQKDIQYASRGRSHVARQEQIHRLHHVIRELSKRRPEAARNDPAVQELTAYGCHTTTHLVRLLSPRLAREDQTKDIDFSRAGITTRWRAGYEHARRILAEKPWGCDVDPLTGIVVHESAD